MWGVLQRGGHSFPPMTRFNRQHETFVRSRRYAVMTQPDIWYVAYGPDKTVKTDIRVMGSVRSTRTFKTEVDAKLFATQILAKGWSASAGTLNPYQPKKIVGPPRWSNGLNPVWASK
jgi:hypothetical protein